MRKHIWIAVWALAILPAVLVAMVYSRLPAQIPTHWNLDGTVTYSAKHEIWMITGMAPLFAALFRVLPKIDPRKHNYTRFQGAYDGFCLFLMAFLAFMVGLVLSESLFPGRVSVGRAVTAALGLLLMVLGNLLPKIKNNYFMGLKNPWTLSNEDVWNRAHRLGGILMFAAGVLALLFSYWLPEPVLFGVVVTAVIASAGIPTVMSYFWYRELEK